MDDWMVTKEFPYSSNFDFSEPASIKASASRSCLWSSKSNFIKHPAESVQRKSPTLGIQSHWSVFSKNQPYPWRPSSNFSSTGPSAPWLHISNCLCCICNSAQSLSPMAKILTPMAKVLNKVFTVLTSIIFLTTGRNVPLKLRLLPYASKVQLVHVHFNYSMAK